MTRPPDLQPATLQGRPVQADLQTLLGWHARYGVNPSTLAALPTMTHLLTLPDSPGGLGFQQLGGVCVVTGEPLAPAQAWPALARALLSWCTETGLIPCFGPVGADFAQLLSTLGLHTVRLGSTPYIHLERWPQRGHPGARVREAQNRARREELTLREAEVSSEAWRTEADRLARRWLKARRARVAFHWIFQLRPLAHADHKRYFEARQDGRLVGLIAASPLRGRSCWYLEDVLRSEEAPSPTATALVAFALSTLQQDQVHSATLGGVPLALERGWDTLPESRMERLAYRLRPALSHLYSFSGLETFKRRFGPAHWENEYLVFPPGLRPTSRVCLALGRLVLGA